jgi:hypothetical protein
MTENNVIDLTARRRSAPPEDAARNAQREDNRNNEAKKLLDTLRTKKRILPDDQSILASNLGREIATLEREAPMRLAKTILLDTNWSKRKRYVRFPNEGADSRRRYAASGGALAGIIDRLINEKIRRGISRSHALIETVNGVLKGTSFRPPSRFQMRNDLEDDGVYFVNKLTKILDKLAQDAGLREYFDLVSRFHIYPIRDLSESQQLRLDARYEPNDLYEWDLPLDDDEIQTWVPWWAPKCIIGHAYLPFQCEHLWLTGQPFMEISEACGGEITKERWWSESCSSLVERFISPEFTRPDWVYHRLPVWLILLPSRTGLTPCLYAQVHDIFRYVMRDEWRSSCEYIEPCFVKYFGRSIDSDSLYFADGDDLDTGLYIAVGKSDVMIIGHDLDHNVKNFKAMVYDPWHAGELPEWLYDQPVQRFLKLTTGSDAAKRFALSQWFFPESAEPFIDGRAVFRPSFANPVSQHVPALRQNTIAAYLLRNFVGGNGAKIYDALINNAVTKHAAAKQVIENELGNFEAAFDHRYGK